MCANISQSSATGGTLSEAEAKPVATAITRNPLSWGPCSQSLRASCGHQLLQPHQGPATFGAMCRTDPEPWSLVCLGDLSLPCMCACVHALGGAPYGLQGVSSPFSALCSRHGGPELVCNFRHGSHRAEQMHLWPVL